MTLSRPLNKQKKYGLTAFLWGLALAALIVVPIMVYDKGYFLYYGDFNVQQIPFYQLAHDEIISGHTGWTHLTDLGANFIGSYSFYLLCSPFFLVTLLLPSAAVPYAIGPLLMLKLALAAFTGYIYLRRYVRDKRYAVIGGLLYAFSSFSLYNIFFFHFHEPMILFPLLLAAVDEFHYTGRRGLTAIAVFACATVNYYFFFGQALFVIIYYVIKCAMKSYRFRVKDFLLFGLECVLGVACSMFIMLPSLAAITDNYRVSEFINGWSALLYSAKRYLQIFISFFFPGDLPAKPNFTPGAGGKWSSVAAYLPMFSMIYVIAYLRAHKRSLLRTLFSVLIVMAFVPVLNSMFQALNSNYYARWFYMMTLVLALMTVKSLDSMKEINFWNGFIPTAAITGAVTVLIGLTPYESFRSSADVIYKFGLEEHDVTFWLFSGATASGLGGAALLYLLYTKKPKLFFRVTAAALSVFIVGCSSMYLWYGKMCTDTPDSFMIENALNQGADITLDDVNEVRSDFIEAPDNLGMYWQIPSVRAFHSIVPASIMRFYNSSGEQRDVGSRAAYEHYGFRALLSVKYLFIKSGAYEEGDSRIFPGFEYLRAENGYDIYENKYYIPMGFTYDSYYCEEEYLNLSGSVQHLALLKGLVLTQYQMKKYADITGYEDGMYLELNSQYDENHPQNRIYPSYPGFDSITSSFEYSTQSYFNDAERLRSNSCSSFEYTDSGFKAEFDNKGKDNLLFFSVPYDSGWTAYVNGEKAEIEQVNLGFMAVKVKGGEKSEIVFTYSTPLLKEGALISAAGAAALLCYILAFVFINRKKGVKHSPRRSYRFKLNHDTNGATRLPIK